MPYRRLAGFYFFYFAVLGAVVPYFGLYLGSIGMGPRDIGALMAVIMVARIVAPLVWGWVADHRGAGMPVVRAASFAAAIAFFGVFAGESFWWLALILAVFSFFWNASLPLLEVFVLRHTAGRPGAYGRVRLWGSLGFIASVTALGSLIEVEGPGAVLWVAALLLTGIFLFSLALPSREVEPEAHHAGSLRDVVRAPHVAGFLLACLLMQIGHGPYYTFYTIYLSGLGYAKTTIGFLWALGVLAEIVMFLAMPRFLAQVPLRRILLWSFLAAAVRWLTIGFAAESIGALVCAQLLHGATFGSFHAAAIQLVHRFFAGRHRHRGQAIYGAGAFGLGGAIGSYGAGWMWESAGPVWTYGVGALAALLAFLVAKGALRDEYESVSDQISAAAPASAAPPPPHHR